MNAERERAHDRSPQCGHEHRERAEAEKLGVVPGGPTHREVSRIAVLAVRAVVRFQCQNSVIPRP